MYAMNGMERDNDSSFTEKDFVFDFDSHVIAQRGEYIYLHIDGRDVEIGKYESHERAQEVLKEMIEMNVIEVAYYMPEV